MKQLRGVGSNTYCGNGFQSVEMKIEKPSRGVASIGYCSNGFQSVEIKRQEIIKSRRLDPYKYEK